MVNHLAQAAVNRINYTICTSKFLLIIMSPSKDKNRGRVSKQNKDMAE